VAGSSSDNSGNAVRSWRRCRTDSPLYRRPGFRNYCRVTTASPPMALTVQDHKVGGNAVVLSRR
jgi:predicted alpha/beta hydrolase